MANSRSDEARWLRMETWSKLADICYNLGRKGRGVRVVGRFKQERWNDAGGKTHSKISIAAEHVESRPELKHEETPESAELSNG